MADRPVKIGDLFGTIYTVLGVPLGKVNQSPLGRPIKVVESGQPVKELLS